MATLREIRGRITGIRNTQKITKAMKMVAAARFRRAQEAIVAARPYARKISQLLRHLVSHTDVSLHPLLVARDVNKIALVVVTADRGLCGAFNGNIIKTAEQEARTTSSDPAGGEHRHRLITVGKKGFDYFNKRNYDLYAKHVGIFSDLAFNKARAIVAEVTEGFLKGKFDKVVVIYNEFKSVIQQRIVVEQLLPVPPEEIVPDRGKKSLPQVDYIYEPSGKEIMDALVPKHLNFQMWRILLESNAAEQGARMSAMDNATENARELIKELTLSFNNARQAAITKELLEIVSGAEALKKAG
ncbi:MAG: ATP synthase F1 subunit gamma [Ignavibacteriales bacterium]|nr:ATP synthase F1 subunit gamma [Ignavibacteriales bacterium]